MKARDMFGVGVRLGGGWFVLNAIGDLFYITVKLLHLPTGSVLPVAVDYEIGGFNLALGLILLVGANLIVRLIYGPEPN